MKSTGTKIHFDTRAPTDDELETCQKIDMTSQSEWNPGDVKLSKVSTQSDSNGVRTVDVNLQRRIAENQTSRSPRHECVDPSSDEALLHSIAPSLVDMREQLQANLPREISQASRCDEGLEDLPTRQTCTSTDRHGLASAEVLADRFGIGLERARQTIKATHERGVRSAMLPISR